MKKSKLAKRLKKLLKTYENSKMGLKQAREVIDLLVIEGMLPPFSKQADIGCECGCKGRCPIGHDWDSEYLKDGANQVERIYR